jgi:hypothetical protein
VVGTYVTNDYLLLSAVCWIIYCVIHLLRGMWIRPTLKNNPYVLSGVVSIHCVGYMPWRFVCVGTETLGGFTARLKAENCVSPRKTVNAVFRICQPLRLHFRVN